MQVGTLHIESLRFLVIHSPTYPLILGMPWLRQHNPHIFWRKEEINSMELDLSQTLHYLSTPHSHKEPPEVPSKYSPHIIQATVPSN
ncbi:hypothetical protein QQF64_035908 [Cirrhinus molitorella]|uniref:Uncharacterized protein n=1 Tax=Cirrhinus molitorella TaxID=172907 RepID=A0ABR3NH28_9TELE